MGFRRLSARSPQGKGGIERLVLVSGSPRRRLLLEQLGIAYSVYEPNIDESADGPLGPKAYVRQIARRKMAAYMEGIGLSHSGSTQTGADRTTGGGATTGSEGSTGRRAERWALAADTVVALGRRIIGKPADRREADSILRALSGRSHRVITAVALFNPYTGRVSVQTETTKVVFARLSDEEIAWYLRSGEWRDVAGGYRIQERGSVLVKRIVGSYSNVVGLPIERFYGMVQAQGYKLFPIGE